MFGASLANRANSQSLRSDNPYYFAVLGAALALPISSMNMAAALRLDYLGAAYRDDAAATDAEALHPFAAERNACALERRLGEVAARVQPLHPRLTICCDDPALLRAVALGQAFRRIRYRSGADGGRHVLDEDDAGPEMPLTARGVAPIAPFDVLAAIRRGLLQSADADGLVCRMCRPPAADPAELLRFLGDFDQGLQRSLHETAAPLPEAAACVRAFRLLIRDEAARLRQQRAPGASSAASKEAEA